MTIDKVVKGHQRQKGSFAIGTNYALDEIQFDLDFFDKPVPHIHIYRGRGQDSHRGYFFERFEGKFYLYEIKDKYC